MTYINDKVLLDAKGILGNDGKYTNFSWFLIGLPTNFIMKEEIPGWSDEDSGYSSYIFENGRFTFKDYNVAGFTEFVDKSKMKAQQTESNGVEYIFSGTVPNTSEGKSSVQFTIAGVENTKSAGYKNKLVLCLCAIKNDINDFSEVKQAIISTQDTSGLFTTSEFEGFGLSTIYTHKDDNHNYIFNNIIDDVIVAYDVSSGESYINSYNFSGFVVGDTTVTVNGLFSIN